MSYVFFKYFAHYDTVIQMAMQVEGWGYAMSQKGRTFNLYGHAFQWTGVRIQKIKVTRKILEFSVSLNAETQLPKQVSERLLSCAGIEVDCVSSGTTASGQCQRAAYRSVREVTYEAMSKLIPCDQIDRQNT
jgi:hypothetical protein